MKKAWFILLSGVLLSACTREISLDTYKDVTAKYCDCIDGLSTLENYEQECEQEDKAVTAERSVVWHKINDLDKNSAYYKEITMAFEEVETEYLKRRIKAMESVNERQRENDRLNYLNSN